LIAAVFVRIATADHVPFRLIALKLWVLLASAVSTGSRSMLLAP
jgi:hypothetical protein